MRLALFYASISIPDLNSTVKWSAKTVIFSMSFFTRASSNSVMSVFLFGDEALQLLDSVHGLFPVVAVNFGLFLLLPEAENLVGDGVVVLFIVCLFDKLFLQFLKPCLNADYSDAPEAPVRIVGKHLSGLRDALRQHICGEAALELHSDDSP